MAGLGGLGGSLAMQLFGPREPEPREEEAVSTPPADPGLLDRLLQWLTTQTPEPAPSPPGSREAVYEMPATPQPGQRVGEGDVPMPYTGGPRAPMMRAQVPGQYGADLGALASLALIGRGGVGKPTLPLLKGVTLERAKQGDIPIPRYPDPDVKTMQQYFEVGAKHPAHPLQWYTEGQKAGELLVGEEEPLLRLFGAILSQRKGPIPETDLAMKAWRAYKERGIEGLRTVAGPSAHQRQEMIEGALRFAEGSPESHLRGALSPGSMKRRDYFRARGPEDVSVIDVHAGDIATRGQFQPDDPRHYFGVQQVYHELADKAGVPRRGYQAAVWVPWREEQAILRGLKTAGDPSPAARIILARAERNPDWQALVKQGLAHAPPIDWRKMLLWSVLGTTGVGGAAGPAGAEPSSDGSGPSRAASSSRRPNLGGIELSEPTMREMAAAMAEAESD